jgi:type VI secretion system protein ImpH
MQTAKRQSQSSVIQRLLEEPFRFDLVQAIRLIIDWLRQSGIPESVAWRDIVRFQNSISMSFPASQIEALVVDSATLSAEHKRTQIELLASQLKRLTITPAYLGFLGAGGAMPSHYTEGIASQILRQRFDGTRAFFDIFTNRIIALHYQAMVKHRVQHRLDASGRLAIEEIQLALAGRKPHPPPEQGGDACIRSEVFEYYAAVVRHRPVSATLIESVLSEYFNLPIKVEQCVGAWDQMKEHELNMLGRPNATLGRGMTLGGRCWERHSRARLHIGPLARPDFENFLPGRCGHLALTVFLDAFTIPTIEFDARLILRVADVKPMRLSSISPMRLGIDTVLLSKPASINQVIPLRLTK